MDDISDILNQYHYSIPCAEFSVQLGDSTIKCAKGKEHISQHVYTGEDQFVCLTGVSPSIRVRYTRQAYNVLSSKGIKPFGLDL
jgi:hypothetical protein